MAVLRALLLFGALSLSTYASNDAQGLKSLLVHFERQVATSAQVDRLHKRANQLPTKFSDPTFVYMANFSLGTPPQGIKVQIDTGSADLIVRTTKSQYCIENPNLCYDPGYYNPNKSSTYHFINNKFNASFGFSAYQENTGALGDTATDDLHVGGAVVKNLQFGVALRADIEEGVLGLGYKGYEAQVTTDPDTQGYANLPLAMTKQGIINSPAYSVWHTTPEAKSGSILFGAVDKKKFTGELRALDIPLRGAPYHTDICVYFGGFTLRNSRSDPVNYEPSELEYATSVDTGSVYSILPDEVMQPVIDKLNGTYSRNDDLVYVDCKYEKTPIVLDFKFPGIIIGIDLSSFIDNSTTPCSLTMAPAGPRNPILGVTFLSHVYTVFDLQRNQVLFGRRDWNSTGSEIVPIKPGKPKPAMKVVPIKITPSGTVTLDPASPQTAAATAGSDDSAASAAATSSVPAPSSTPKKAAATSLHPSWSLSVVGMVPSVLCVVISCMLLAF